MSERTEIEGINYVERIVNNELGWIWRNIFARDHGFDGKIEIAEQYNKRTTALSREICVQIKSGESYFPVNSGNAVVRIDDRIFKYWSDSVQPVIIIVYSPVLQKAYWIEFNKGVKHSSKGNKSIEIPLNDHYIFNDNAKSVLHLLSLRVTKYGLANSGFIDQLAELLHETPLEQGDRDIVRSLFFSAEVNYLVKKKETPTPVSLLAIDTSIEDFNINAWQKDKDYQIYLQNLLSIKSDNKRSFNYTQIFSISVPLIDTMIWHALIFQIKLLLTHRVKVGVVNRTNLSTDINRDFSIINNDLVMNYNIGTWNCTPNPGMVPSSVHEQIFKEVSSKTFWCVNFDWQAGLAKYLQYPLSM